MLGDCVNFFSQADLNRFYVSSMAGYFPLERNAFDVERKRCQTRKLRSVQASQTLLFVCVSDHNVADYNVDGLSAADLTNQVESNVVDLFAKKQMQADNAAVLSIRSHLKWKAHYQRELESA